MTAEYAGFAIGFFTIGVISTTIVLLFVPSLINLLTRLSVRIHSCGQKQKKRPEVSASFRNNCDSYAEIELSTQAGGLAAGHVNIAIAGSPVNADNYESLRDSHMEQFKYSLVEMDGTPVYQDPVIHSDSDPYEITRIVTDPQYEYVSQQSHGDVISGNNAAGAQRQSRSYFILEPVTQSSNAPSTRQPYIKTSTKKQQPMYFVLKPQPAPKPIIKTPNLQTNRTGGEDEPIHTYHVLEKQT